LHGLSGPRDLKWEFFAGVDYYIFCLGRGSEDRKTVAECYETS